MGAARPWSSNAAGAMAMHNEDVAAAFDEMADLLAIQGDNPFRIRAYRRAAQVVRSLPRDLGQLGGERELEALRRKVAPGLRELLDLPGLGPARVRALREGLGIRGIGDLERALASGRLGSLQGFGSGIESRLRAALGERTARGARRVPWPIAALKGYADLRELTAAGRTKASGVLRNGLQVDVRVVPPESFGTALHYFTGSRDHNIHLRRRAQERGWKLSEYGLFRGKTRLAGATEEELFAALDLPLIAPELREDRGEIELAERRALPELIERRDLHGDLHVHTDASDGREPLGKLVAAARRQRLEYLAVTDHSKHLGIVGGLDAGRLARQIDAIDALNEKLDGLVLLKGAEVDILEDGALALPDSILRRLDLVVVAIHDHFALSESKQTARILRALERPCVSILAHPTGRLLDERTPCALEFERVLAAARERPCYLEINGQPRRLDLDDVHVKAARDRGVLLSIASDAHSGAELAFLEHGIRQARRGWLTRRDVLNAHPLGELRKLLRATMR